MTLDSIDYDVRKLLIDLRNYDRAGLAPEAESHLDLALGAMVTVKAHIELVQSIQARALAGSR
jgi:hypothetical protein